MRSRPLAAILLALASPTAACQLIWSYDEFKDQHGTGGSGASGGAPSSSTASSASTTASSSGGGAPSSSSSSGGPCIGGPQGQACTDSCDEMVVAAHQATIQDDVKTCTVQSLGNPNPMCIAKTVGLSMECAACWAAAGNCGYQHCFFLAPCSGDVNSADCNACLHKNCDCAFTACSGTIRPAAVDAGADVVCD
ncbi:MAG: hypothetical protein QM820_46335 [Minicystis sp.]